jgi:hypothetical protein
MIPPLSPQTVVVVVLASLYGAYLVGRAWHGWLLYSNINFNIATPTKARFEMALLFLTFIAIPQTLTAPAVVEGVMRAGLENAGLGPTLLMMMLYLPVSLLGLILSPFILDFFGKAETAAYAATPFDALTESAANNTDKIFNFFVSYKSEDVAIARQHTDRLIANRLTVWFAEYMILLQNYDQFESAINRGLRQSDFGFLFTNDRYFASQWCLHELEGLLKPENCGPENILEVRLADAPVARKKIPALATIASMPFAGNVDEIIQVHEDCMPDAEANWRKPIRATNKRYIFHDERFGYHLDLTGWQMYFRGVPGLTKDGFIGPAFRRKVGGKWLGLHISVGIAAAPRRDFVTAEFSEEHVRRAVQAAQTRESIHVVIPDDREHYKQARKFAEEWEKENGVKVVGLHLFFYAGSSHLALTYASKRGWNRRYSIVLMDPESGLSIEFALVFKFMGLFTEYCKYTRFMDALVYSLH